MKEAEFFISITKGGKKKAKCTLCPHECVIDDGKTGFCKVRKNINGKIYALTYNKPVSIAVDPIEKKPLYHFHPGEKILSLGTFGCNFSCMQCQNFDISREFSIEDLENIREITSDEIIKICKNENLKMIAYTYNEPTVFYEYMFDIAKKAKKNGIENVIVSNGFINKEPLQKLLPFIDAANIDLKSFDDNFYRKICNGSLNIILENLKIINKKCHLEITCLLIPKYNDDMKKIEEMCIWIKNNLGENVPLHFSRFFPRYKLYNLYPTPTETLLHAEKIGKKYLKNVYLGNI